MNRLSATRSGYRGRVTRLAVIANTTKLLPPDAQKLRDALAAAGLGDHRWLTIAKGSQAKQAAKKAMARGADTVLVCGGDGTVRAATEAVAGTETRLAVYPAGTANLFATALGIPSDFAELAALVAGGSTVVLDVGSCNGMAFNVMGGIGFDAAMIDRAEDDKEQLGTIAYVRAGVREVREREEFPVRVKVDGEVFFDGDATCVLVGNIGTLKGGVRAFPDATPTDGTLDVAVLTAAGVREWASLMVSALRRRQALSGHAQLSRGTKITVRTPAKHRYELDGGVKGRENRLRFGVAPGALRVCATQTPS